MERGIISFVKYFSFVVIKISFICSINLYGPDMTLLLNKNGNRKQQYYSLSFLE